MTKPIIGIPGNTLSYLSSEYSGVPVAYTPQGFVVGVQRAYGLPVTIPIGEPANAEEYIERIDGLLLAGGQDVFPLLYGEEPHPKLEVTNPERDYFELALIKEASKQEKPILAVCRGMQLLNVAFGGTLYQDLSQNPSFTIQHVQPTFIEAASHTVSIDPESRLGAIHGKTMIVNSFHHQGINSLADCFKAVAWSKDGLIEAFESMDKEKNIIAIQWHPEVLVEKEKQMQYLFDDFVSRVKKSIAPAF